MAESNATTEKTPKRVIVLGATGSIGTSALSLLAHYPDEFTVVGLSAHTQAVALAKLGKQFGTDNLVLTGVNRGITAGTYDEGSHEITQQGQQALSRMIRNTPADLVIHGISGSSGLQPSIDVLQSGKHLALANKETLVMGGPLITNLAKQMESTVIPIDSEHSAIQALLRSIPTNRVSSLIITASGGPFFGYTKDMLTSITKAKALEHPTWSMGPKITIDSATLANKGLEVIEAHHFFQLPYDRIEVVIHPQSIVHSMVRLTDGSIHSQMGHKDMRGPIYQALSYPDIPVQNYSKHFDMIGSSLEFFAPDMETFPHLSLAYQVGRAGGVYPIAYNRANEEGVWAFLAGKIGFTQLYELIDQAVQHVVQQPITSIEEVVEVDTKIKAYTRSLIKQKA